MQAWTIPAFGIENLALTDHRTPQPGPGQVLVEVKAASLNYRDLMVTLGLYNPKMHLPRIPASDGAGIVAAVGEGVTRVQPGDRVCGIFMQNWLDGRPTPEKVRGALGGDIDGMLATHVLLNAEGVVHFPEYLSFEEAATLPCAALTAWNALVTAGHLTAGETVLIQGTGGVSIFALQLAKAMGARVIGTSGSDEKLARAQTLGLDAGVNYRTTPDWAKWVLEQTGGLGADVVVEVGGAGTFAQSLTAVRMGGTVAQIGVLSQSKEPVHIPAILHKQVHLQGIYVGSRANFEAMNRALAQNHIRPVVDKVFGFRELPDALRRMQAGEHFGKIVLQTTD
ncbi:MULTISPECIES: NAD(P)-dependent alcohol dehydrogenase [Acidobacterium]|uniref:Oxidoreductase, zinc-binding dehydrogenase family n=1 Tax=Acidobacterium capsulatum (strain ATCC 51196 / DSM 11244 / BCRC 80197 / JCM 7670 / NBRC 15755 / NCIMB 13165 / 161) TaxID=240015 RepID=C1F6H8_ACIC5|nr:MULTISPECIES: NAD(P)-dependent alcohol dehydrogenase [Acidobacterium]ACO34306.1 oxidoreductase, zinc-binding dehydrogenase family [Acidobacterium capsulatum ATCC 51196]HCT60868.1 NAD(P)-dependent alcohol dehydrogenase [Acidobacterium sp.]